jgi:hypothetical protein
MCHSLDMTVITDIAVLLQPLDFVGVHGLVETLVTWVHALLMVAMADWWEGYPVRLCAYRRTCQARHDHDLIPILFLKICSII